MKPMLRFGLRDRTQTWLRRCFVEHHIRHVHGPAKFSLAEYQTALILLGRDVRYFLPVLFEHYRALGVEHFVFLDNGSQDGSVDYAARQEGTIVASCDLNFRDYQAELRFLAATLFAEGGWRLAIDADELLDYPNAQEVPIPSLVSRLTKRGHTGLVAQMLEMAPKGRLPATVHKTFSEAVDAFRFFSLGHIASHAYLDLTLPTHTLLSRNTPTNDGIKVLFGGLRKTLFGENCMLTKHVLFKAGANVLPLPHPHVTCGLVCTDFSAVLRHYKFSGNYLERECQRRAQKRLSHHEGDMRLRVFEAGDAVFLPPDLREGATAERLLEEGFIVASPQAREMLSL